MEATNHIDLIGRLKADVETYTRLLGEASEYIVAYDRLGGITRGVAHNQLGSKISDLQQELDSFAARFRTNRLVDIAIQQSTIQDTLDKVHDMNVAEKLEKWLRSPPDMAAKQHETQRLHMEGTGRWFLDGEAFIQWQDYPGALWIQGPSGSGKSVLSATAIQNLVEDRQLAKDLGKSFSLAFFYFDFKTREGQAVEIALRRILLQLSAQSPHPYSALEKQYSLSNGQTLPNFRDLQHVLEELLREVGRTYIIFDALDECPGSEHGQLIDLITMLLHWTDSPLHLLITSQPRAIFTEKFTAIPYIFLESDITQHDIKLFITTELRENRKLKIWASRASEIVDRVVVKSSGMFRLAACLLVELSHCKRQNELEQTLENLPIDLFGIYDRFLDRIRPEDLVYVTGILRWLVFSAYSLSIEQLADAVAFHFSKEEHYTYDPSIRRDHLNAIPEWFEGLARAPNWDGLVLSHASVQDYIMSSHFTNKFGYDLRSGPSHTFIAHSCISYFLHFVEHPLNEETLPNYPLTSYAAEFWCHHLLRAADQTALFPEAMHLLDEGSKQYTALNYGGESQPARRPMRSPLLLCCKEGYIEGARYILEKGADVNAEGRNGTALQAACRGGHTDVAQLLLENGANVNAQCGVFGNALQAASAAGDPGDIVPLLLQKGAAVNAEGGFFGTALQVACYRGHADVVQLLLQNGANVNAQCGEYGNALQAATVAGNPTLVRLLLDKGADVNAKGGILGSALQAALTMGRPDIVNLLRASGAESQPNKYGGY
ncbi:hypothetical protein B0H11DRAFT_1866618 [Mycena galericulata]|nr:hypothetical protein B0H11DRAFT_1866618 [Mycena galericulata]